MLTVEGSLASRDGRGGTAPIRVREQLAEVRDLVAGQAAWAAQPPMNRRPVLARRR